MKILIHSINFAPELTGIGKYTGELAAWLAEAGHEVRVVTAPPYYPQWRIAEGHANRWSVQRDGDGRLTVWRCPLWVPRHPSGLKRLLHLASFAFASLPVMLRQAFWRPDAVLVVEPPLFCAPQAWLVARLSGARAWLHVQDFEVDAAFDLGILRSQVLRRWVLACERFLLRRFDRVSTISEKMLDRLVGMGVAAGRCMLFPNWVDTQAIHPLPRPSVYRDWLGLTDQGFVALYSGNMGEKQGLEVVLEAARRLEDEEHICFVLCGDGAVRARLQAAYADLGNVIWLPLQPVAQLNELLNLADVHLLPQRADAADLVMPSRLVGMLASARPVLATALPETQIGHIVTQCGRLTPPGDADALAQTLRELAAEEADRHRLGMAGRRIVEKRFSRENVLAEFERELTELPGA
jgi:colanic acid biosynthesis glycosyl transferase WcaI